MLDQRTVSVNPTWDDAQLGKREVEEMCREVLRMAEVFATKENWEKNIGDVV